MNLQNGTRLGPYEIVAPIGAGGMGEVYKARDTRLDRDVAVKVLPSDLSSNEQFRLRFEREAKAISALTHPNICTLHDIGRENGIDYLVMELLDGETLSKRLERGALLVEDVLRYGTQVAEALDRAHRQGVVHRDLKPANIMLTKSGAKLLDFGLAKLRQTQPAIAGLTNVPTEHRGLTQEGTILGTFQYMAPEQLEGDEADARTDIFALGAVLYEMATGHRAFEGKNKTSLIAAIVDRDPRPMSQVQPLTPPALEHVVWRCLRKQPEERWQSALDVAAELRWISEVGSQAGVAAPVARRRRTREWAAWAMVAILAASLATTMALQIRDRARRTLPPVIRTDLGLMPPVSNFVTGKPITISPDGKRVAYINIGPEGTRIFLRSLDRLDIVSLSGTDLARFPFFSPDGDSLGFFAGNTLRKVSVSGGPPQTIVEESGFDPYWATDGTILFASDRGIARVLESGGQPELILPIDTKKGHVEYRSPSLLPGSRSMLFSIVGSSRSWIEQTIAVYDFKSRRIQELRGGTNPRYLDTGHLLYAAGGSLFAVTFDPKTARAGKNSVAMVEGVVTNQANGMAAFDVSQNGSLLYVAGRVVSPTTRLVWLDRKGTRQPLPLPPRPYEHPRVSPNGKALLMAVRDVSTDVWVFDSERGTLSRLTFEPHENETPIWFPGGDRVLFSATRRGHERTHFTKAANGTGSEQAVLKSQAHQHASSISPDGKLLAYTEFTATTAADLWLTPLDGSGKPRVLLRTPFEERSPRFSPDGRWVAYTSNESGRSEVYVIAPDGSGKWQISTEGGFAPVWSRDGRELFYRSENRMMAVNIATSASFSAGVPRVLFEGEFHNLPRGDANYDVSPDGRRFLMLERESESRPSPTVLTVNWFEELRRLVPATR